MNIQDYIWKSTFKHDRFKEDVEAFEKTHPDIQKQWVGLALGFNEYADGVTGVNYFGRLVAEDNENGFKMKGDVRRALLDNDIHIGRMKVVGKAFNGGYRHSGWDQLITLKVPGMIAWMKEHDEYHRLKYSEWNFKDVLSMKEK